MFNQVNWSIKEELTNAYGYNLTIRSNVFNMNGTSYLHGIDISQTNFSFVNNIVIGNKNKYVDGIEFRGLNSVSRDNIFSYLQYPVRLVNARNFVSVNDTMQNCDTGGLIEGSSNVVYFYNTTIKNITQNYDSFNVGMKLINSNNLFLNNINITEIATVGVLIQNCSNISIINPNFDFIPISQRSNYLANDGDEPRCAIQSSQRFRGYYNRPGSYNLTVLGASFDNDTPCYLYLENQTLLTHDLIGYWNPNAFVSPVGVSGKYEYYIPNYYNNLSGWNGTGIYYDIISDLGGNSNSSSVTFSLDTTAPSLKVANPINLQEFNYNTSINVNYTVSDALFAVNTCLLSIDGGANSTIASCANTTINVSDGSHNIVLCSNDSLNNLNCTAVSFTVSLDAPAIVLDSPTTGTYWKNGTKFYLNYTATDSNGISVCQIWHNLNGTFALNRTNTGVSSGVMNFTTYNILDGTYSWNIWCNDTTGKARFSATNRTFIIDTTLPSVSINTPITTTVGSQSIQFTDVSTDTNLASCKYSVYNSSGSIDGLYENITKTCNSASTATVSGYATYTVRSYALDLAGNENYAEENVTTTASSPGSPGGGGAGQDVEKIPVVGVQNVNESTKKYNPFELEVIYARLNDYCAEKKDLSEKPTLAIQDYSGECSLTLADLKIVQARISEQGISVAEDDLIKLFRQFTGQLLFQGYESSDTVEKYKLFTSVLGITNPMKINPPSLSRAFVISSDGEPRNVSYAFSVNKNIRECTIIRGENMHCEVLSNTTFRVVQYINDTNFFDKTFEGEVTITSQASAQNLEVRTVPVFMTVYNLQGLILGIPAYIFGIGMIIILFVIVFLIFSNKKIRRKFNGKS